MRVDFGADIEVVATERWLDELRAGRAFGYGTRLAAGGAGINSHLQLFNPAASGATILLRTIIAGTTIAGDIHIRAHNTALTTLESAGVNLLAGGAAGQGQVRSQNAATLGSLLMRIPQPASETVRMLDEWIVELGPGEGVLVTPNGANLEVFANYLWVELI